MPHTGKNLAETKKPLTGLNSKWSFSLCGEKGRNVEPPGGGSEASE
jgi:hypothetical protein